MYKQGFPQYTFLLEISLAVLQYTAKLNRNLISDLEINLPGFLQY